MPPGAASAFGASSLKLSFLAFFGAATSSLDSSSSCSDSLSTLATAFLALAAFLVTTGVSSDSS